jgi:hypothetical protein
MHVRDYVASAVHDRRPARRAQRDVQHGSAFRDIDLLGGEHGFDIGAQAGLLGEPD